MTWILEVREMHSIRKPWSSHLLFLIWSFWWIFKIRRDFDLSPTLLGRFLQCYTNNTTAMMTYCHTTLVVFIFTSADPASTSPARPGAGHDMTYLAPPPHSSCLSSFSPFLLKLLVALLPRWQFSSPLWKISSSEDDVLVSLCWHWWC